MTGVSRASELHALALFFVNYGMVRITTANMPLISQLQQHLTYKHMQMIRRAGKSHFVSEAVPCYEISQGPAGSKHIVAGIGFLPEIAKLCEELGVAWEAYDLTTREEMAIDTYEPVPVRIPKTDWTLLRAWQQDAIRIMRTKPAGRFNVPTGDGKSTLIRMFLKFAHKSTFVIVTRTQRPLLDLYSGALTAGIDCAIDCSQQKKGNIEKARVLFVTTGKLKYYLDREFDYLFGDEIHEHPVADSLPALLAVRARRRMGFSGNADKRADGAQKWLAAIYGPVVMTRKYEDSKADGNVVPIYYKALQTGFTGELPDRCTQSQQEALLVWRNHARNAAFARVGHYWLAQGKTVVALTRTTEQALAFRKYFKAPLVVGDISDQRMQYFVSQGLLKRSEVDTVLTDSFETQRKFAAGEVRAVIAGPEWHKGVDLPNLDVLLRLDAMSSFIANTQLPGRLSRTYPGKKYGLLVDAMDEFNNALNLRWHERRRDYARFGWKPWEGVESELG